MVALAQSPTPTVSAKLRARPKDDARVRHDRLLFERRDAGDGRARDQLIERFLPLARSLARRYEHSGESCEDLAQVASLALVKAVDRYQPSRGHAFSSFAVPTIVGELKRHFRDRTWAVRPPRDLQERTLRVEKATERLTQQLDHTPTVSEIAEATQSTNEQVLEALQARSGRGALSLQALVGGCDDEGQALGDTIGVEEAGFEDAETHAVLAGLLDVLAPRERMVLRLRFEQDMTQSEIGAAVGVSQMQISRIMRQSIQRLRSVANQRDTAALRSLAPAGFDDPATGSSRRMEVPAPPRPAPDP
ncbi:MAG: SigB/SigF/SigG family RNA polymerase sigma factor, partial [Solirubrobacteraceae bacterium]